MSIADIRSEIPRTFIHILGGLLLAGIGFTVREPWNQVILGAVFLLVVLMEGTRLFLPQINDLVRRIIGPFMRPHEHRSLTGAPAFFGGVFLSFLLFDRTVALAALVPLIFGDRAALLVGKALGRVRLGRKTVEGSLACAGSTLGVYLLLSVFWHGIFPYRFPVFLGASIVGTMAEMLPRPWDDNLTIPLAVGIFLFFVK